MSHQNQEELEAILDTAQEKVSVDDIYEHYKTKGQYKVLFVGLLESNEEPHVVYQLLESKKLIWIRPLNVWDEKVKNELGQSVPRFKRVDDN